MQSRIAIFCEYVKSFGIALSGGANYFIRLLAEWFLPSATLPRIAEARIRVDPYNLPSFRWFRGSLIIVNNSRRRYTVTYLRVRDGKQQFQINNVSDHSEMDMTSWIKGRIKSLLPSPVEAGESKTIFFGGLHEVETFEELPENLLIEISFDCMQEPMRCNLKHNSEVEDYGLYTFGAAKTRETQIRKKSTNNKVRRKRQTTVTK